MRLYKFPTIYIGCVRWASGGTGGWNFIPISYPTFSYYSYSVYWLLLLLLLPFSQYHKQFISKHFVFWTIIYPSWISSCLKEPCCSLFFLFQWRFIGVATFACSVMQNTKHRSKIQMSDVQSKVEMKNIGNIHFTL